MSSDLTYKHEYEMRRRALIKRKITRILMLAAIVAVSVAISIALAKVLQAIGHVQ